MAAVPVGDPHCSRVHGWQIEVAIGTAADHSIGHDDLFAADSASAQVRPDLVERLAQTGRTADNGSTPATNRLGDRATEEPPTSSDQEPPKEW